MTHRGTSVEHRTEEDEGPFRILRRLDHSAGWSWRFLVVVAALAVALFILSILRTLVLAAFLALVMGSILGPVVEWLRRHRVPGALGAVITVLGFAVLIAALFFAVMRGLVDDMPDIGLALDEASGEIQTWLADRPVDLGQDIAAGLIDGIKTLVTNVAQLIGESVIQGVTFIAGLFSTLVLALFLTLFSLADWRRVWGWLLLKASEEDRDSVDRAGRRVVKTIRAWFLAQTISAVIDGVGIGIGLILLDIPFVLPLVLLTVLFGYIPIFGAIISGAVVVLVALATQGVETALLALLLVLVVQQIEANLISPFVVSAAVRFHPLATMVLGAVAAALFGILGMFLAVPVAGAVVAAQNELKPKGAPAEPARDTFPSPTGAAGRSDPVG